jgi:hypothetical protein
MPSPTGDWFDPVVDADPPAPFRCATCRSTMHKEYIECPCCDRRRTIGPNYKVAERERDEARVEVERLQESLTNVMGEAQAFRAEVERLRALLWRTEHYLDGHGDPNCHVTEDAGCLCGLDRVRADIEVALPDNPTPASTAEQERGA